MRIHERKKNGPRPLPMHHQRNGLFHRNYQRRRSDVVARLQIIRGIEPKEVLVAFIDLVGM